MKRKKPERQGHAPSLARLGPQVGRRWRLLGSSTLEVSPSRQDFPREPGCPLPSPQQVSLGTMEPELWRDALGSLSPPTHPSRRDSWFLLEVYSWPCPTFTPTLCSFFTVGYPNRPQLQEPQLQSSEPCCLRHPPGSLQAQSHRPAPAANLLLCCPPADIPLPGRAPRYPHLRGSPSQSLSLTQLLPGPFAPHPHRRSLSPLPRGSFLAKGQKLGGQKFSRGWGAG